MNNTKAQPKVAKLIHFAPDMAEFLYTESQRQGKTQTRLIHDVLNELRELRRVQEVYESANNKSKAN